MQANAEIISAEWLISLTSDARTGTKDAICRFQMKDYELADQLRKQVVGGLHIGVLQPGSRLPSIRETAQRYGIDHRAVARAYSQLEADGLVKVRGRSGVYVASARSVELELLDDRIRWFVSVLHEGWARRMAFAELNNLARQTTLHRLRCVCVESTLDHLVAFSSEMASDFGFTIVPIRFTPNRGGDPEFVQRARIEAELSVADCIATTAFHASAVRKIAVRIGKPMIPISIHHGIRDAIARSIRQGPLRVVVADAAFEARARSFLGEIPGGENVELVRVADYKRRSGDGKETVFTKAARRELGLAEFHLLAPDVPFISADSARAICELVVQLAVPPMQQEPRRHSC